MVKTEAQKVKYSTQEFIKSIENEPCDHIPIIPTSEFKYMKFPFENFNPVQSLAFQYVESPNHFVLSSPTSSGKTLVIEMMISWAMAQGKKAIYLSPLKALSSEKMRDWENLEHDFGNKKVSILTGDQGGKTEAKMAELNQSDLIIQTCEMLDVCTRNVKADYAWIKETAVLVVDEAHILTSANRGDKIESAIMRFSELNPNARIILISATMPNLEDLCTWLKKISGKQCDLLRLNYRPVPLKYHYIVFTPEQKVSWANEQKIRQSITKTIIDQYPDHSVLSFVMSKSVGNDLTEMLNEQGISSYFFKADLPSDQRNKLFESFYKREFRSLVATSSLAAGNNLPARAVVLTNTKFGPNMEVESLDLTQMAGRAGRKGLDEEGHVYIILSSREYHKERRRIESGQKIESQMQNKNTLAFHILSEIMHKRIKNAKDFQNWFTRTLASAQQGDIDDHNAQVVLDWLEDLNMIKKDAFGEYETTQMGIVCSQMYMPPEDVYDWRKNFKNFFENYHLYKSQQEMDFAISSAFANVASIRENLFASNLEKEHIYNILGLQIGDGVEKITVCYYLTMNPEPYVPLLNNVIQGIKNDIERTISTLLQLGERAKCWPDKTQFFKKLQMRIQYGVPEERIELCTIPGVGSAISKKLFDAGLKTIHDVVSSQLSVLSVAGEKVGNKILIAANDMLGRRYQAIMPQQKKQEEEIDW